MAARGWSGFSDEELKKIRRDSDDTSVGTNDGATPRKITNLKSKSNKARSLQHRTIVAQNETNCEDSNRPHAILPASQCLSSKTANVGSKGSSTPNGLVRLRLDDNGHVLEVVEKGSSKTNDSAHTTTPQLTDEVQQPDAQRLSPLSNQVLSRELSTLEKFQQRQKFIEEQNKHRKALLTKAISERQKKTQKEAEKLVHIQKELCKLDSLVSADVAILRNHIEQASVEFNESQKRYKKAEEEFVEAKIELFKRMERKEQLTEHLCTIIEENEMRKAQKLVELMDELEMESLAEEIMLEQGELILPQLCALNDDAYNFCSTLKLSTSPTLANHSEGDDALRGNDCVSPNLSTITSSDIKENHNSSTTPSSASCRTVDSEMACPTNPQLPASCSSHFNIDQATDTPPPELSQQLIAPLTVCTNTVTVAQSCATAKSGEAKDCI